MNAPITDLLNRLFPQGRQAVFESPFFHGTGIVGGIECTIFGTDEKTPIGIELAHRMADVVLDTVRNHPGRPMVMLVDTTGQRLSRRDEMLGINAYMAHLAKCLDLARRSGHRTIGVVWSQAVSGGFLATSLLADACYALAGAEIQVMNLPAMSRVTKIALERLQELSRESPVFAPGAGNYHKMGAVKDVWDGDVAALLAQALAEPIQGDQRRELGLERQGRLLAQPVSQRVRHDAA